MHLLGHIDKKTLIAFFVMAAALVAFLFYSLSDKRSDAGEIAAVPASPPDVKLGRELLVMLAKLKSTKLDRTIFEDPVFNSLKDFGVQIAPEPAGRRNPFASFAEEATSAGTGSSGAKKATPGSSNKPASAPKTPTGGKFDLE